MAHSLSRLDKVELALVEIEISRINSRDGGGQDLGETLIELRRIIERIDLLMSRSEGAVNAEYRTD